jgi:hypothetical protein
VSSVLNSEKLEENLGALQTFRLLVVGNPDRVMDQSMRSFRAVCTDRFILRFGGATGG